MPANESIPFHETSDFSAKATAAVTGKRFVRPSGSRESGPGLSSTSEGGNYLVAHCGAGLKACGVSTYDAAINTKVGVVGTPGRIVPVTAAAAIAAGAEVMSDATGQAITWTSAASEANRALGQAMTAASGAGVDAEIKLY